METPAIILQWLKFWNSNEPTQFNDLYSKVIVYRDPIVANSISGIIGFDKYITQLFAHFPHRNISLTKYRKFKEADNYLIHWNMKIPDQIASFHVANIDGLSILSINNNFIIKEEMFFDRFPIALSNIYSLKKIKENEQ